MQLLNVVLGGSLIQHIPDEVPNHIGHEQPHPHQAAILLILNKDHCFMILPVSFVRLLIRPTIKL